MKHPYISDLQFYNHDCFKISFLLSNSNKCQSSSMLSLVMYGGCESDKNMSQK